LQSGRCAAAVTAELEALAGVERLPALAALAGVLAVDLDNADLAGSHASLARQLRETLDALRAGVGHGGGKLKLVAAMTARGGA
jgi:hypothetical protein